MEHATWVYPELKSIDDSFESEFSTVCSCRLSPWQDTIVPVSVHKWDIVLEDLIHLGIGVENGEQHSWSTRSCHISEHHVLWWSSSEFNVVVVPALVDESWESGLSLLTGIETIPTVIHIWIQNVIKSTLEVLDMNWLYGTVHAIGIKTREDQSSYHVLFTEICVPIFIQFAICWNDLRRDRHLISWDQNSCAGKCRKSSSSIFW
jgi:hypothetical protein